MVNRQKIITMTKLALYDKHEGAADRATNEYFRHDYIYRKNLGTRISVGIGGTVVLALYWLRIVFVEGIDVFEFDIQHHATDSILFIIAILAVYSVIGTIQGTREYYLVQKRLQQYQGMLRFLENTEVKKNAAEEDKLEEEKPERCLRGVTRTGEARERREPRDSVMSGSLEPRALRGTKDQSLDPLENVSARAMAGARPRTAVPLNRRTPRTSANKQTPPVCLSRNPNDTPLRRTPQKPDSIGDKK